MTADSFKFKIQILGNSDKLEVSKMRKLIDEAYSQLLKKPNEKLLDAVIEAEDYVNDKIELEEYIKKIT